MVVVAAIFPDEAEANAAFDELCACGCGGDCLGMSRATSEQYRVMTPATAQLGLAIAASMAVGIVVLAVLFGLAGALVTGDTTAGFAGGAAFGAFAGFLFGGIAGIVRGTAVDLDTEVLHATGAHEIVVLMNGEHRAQELDAVRHHHGRLVLSPLARPA